MAETSRRSLVTVTLGSGGRVVKKPGFVPDDVASDRMPTAGNKRSIRERLGSNVDDSLDDSKFNSKRLRECSNRSSLYTDDLNDLQVGKDDLRFKLMQKNVLRRIGNGDQQNGVDLREKLSRTIQQLRDRKPPLTSNNLQQRMPERKVNGILGPIPSARIADGWPRPDPLANYCAPWTLDQLRRRSPERVLNYSKGFSSQRNTDELQKRQFRRPLDDVRSVPHTAKDTDTLRSVGSAPFTAKSAVPVASAKPVASILAQVPPLGGIPQKSSFTGDEQSTVDSLLNSLGLGKYSVLFKAEEVDLAALKQMGDCDLKELGIPMGPRKKILLAVMPSSKRQHR